MILERDAPAFRQDSRFQYVAEQAEQEPAGSGEPSENQEYSWTDVEAVRGPS
jgi:hypothetical protein